MKTIKIRIALDDKELRYNLPVDDSVSMDDLQQAVKKNSVIAGVGRMVSLDMGLFRCEYRNGKRAGLPHP